MPKSFRVGTLNVGTMKQKASEVVEKSGPVLSLGDKVENGRH